MKKETILLIFTIIFFFGCLQTIDETENEQYQVIQEKITLLKNNDCSCFVCTESSEGTIANIFTYNDLSSGGCFIKEDCSTNYLITFFHENDKNFLRPFDIGYGNTYFEYEEANLRSSIGLGIMLRELKEYELPNSDNYILPVYGDFEKVKLEWDFTKPSTFFDSDKNPIYRALEKNAIPIYYINSEHLTEKWLNDFFTKTEIADTTSFIAVKSSAENVQDLIKNINSKCTDSGKETTIEKCVKMGEPYCYDTPQGQKCQSVCTEKVSATTMVYGCKSMLYIDYVVNASDVELGEITNQIYQLDPDGTQLKEVDSFLIYGNVTEEGSCHASMVLFNAMNLSRSLMREYGTKPSYLILNIDEKCKTKELENQIAQSISYNIYFMRMTGIMGIIYYNYLPEASKFTTDVETPETLFQLTNYYYNSSYGYNREPLYFDSDGYNISMYCDRRSTQKMKTIDMNTIYTIPIKKLNPEGLSAIDKEGKENWWYVYALPFIDYGEWNKVEGGETSSGGTFDDCNLGYSSGVHLEAERCGVSNYLLMSFSKNNIQFDCESWYGMIDSFVKSGQISTQNIEQSNMNTMKQLAFAYTMNGEKKLFTDSQMKSYCYTSSEGKIADSRPCRVINDYVNIRASFLEYTLYPDCYVADIING